MEDLHAKVEMCLAEEFCNAVAGLMELVVSEFPDCTPSAEFRARILTANTVSMARTKALQMFRESMGRPAATSYAPAFKRITGSEMTFFHTIVYRDPEALFGRRGGLPAAMSGLSLGSKYAAAQSELQNQVWDWLDLMSAAARYQLPELQVPSSEEISLNIKQFRAAEERPEGRPFTSAPLKLVAESVKGLAHLLPEEQREAFEAAADKLDLDGKDRLRKALSITKAGQTQSYAAAAQAGEAGLLVQCPHPLFVEAGLPALFEANPQDPAWHALCKAVAQASTFMELGDVIPPALIGSIEQQAQELQAKLQSGGQIDTAELLKIGQNVASSAPAADLARFQQGMASNSNFSLQSMQSQIAQLMSQNSGPGSKA